MKFIKIVFLFSIYMCMSICITLTSRYLLLEARYKKGIQIGNTFKLINHKFNFHDVMIILTNQLLKY